MQRRLINRSSLLQKQRKQAKLLAILKDIEADRGQLTPADVLEAARPEGSPLHHRFDWDDSEAAEKYRLMQARVLIIGVRVEYNGEKRDAYINARVQLNGDYNQAYFPIERVMSEDALHRQVLSDAVRELEHAQAKYNSLKEFHGVINVRKLKKLKEQVQG